MSEEKIRFGLVTDIHQDLMVNAIDRLREFVGRMNEERVDFIIQLGDFCYPLPENEQFLAVWNSFNGPKYHVLGNHDMDYSDKKSVVHFYGTEGSYYSFDNGGYHFVVLDTNHIRLDGKYIDYEKGNYFKHPDLINHITDEQLEWLERDLAGTDKHTILFSHQNLEDPHIGVKNSDKLRALLRSANEAAGFRKVVACMNGHYHVDGVKVIDDIYFIQMNSASYFYMGEEFAGIRYSEEITKQYPILEISAPYKDPLYAMITLEPGMLSIAGKETEFVGPTPAECGFGWYSACHKVSAKISDRKLKF